jgi:hypothetical protein
MLKGGKKGVIWEKERARTSSRVARIKNTSGCIYGSSITR